MLGLAHASLGATLLDLAAITQSPLDLISGLFAARALGYLIGSFAGGKLIDSLPGHPTIALNIGIISLVLAITPAATSLNLMMIVFLAMGLAEGVIDVGCNTLLVWRHAEKVGPYMNGLHFFFGVGALTAPLIVAQTISLNGGIALPYILLAALCLPSILFLMKLPSPALRTAEKKAAAPLSSGEMRFLLLITVLFFLIVGAEASLGGWIATYGVERQMISKESSPYPTTLFWTIFTFGRLAGVAISMYFSPKRILIYDLIGALLGISVILSAPDSFSALIAGIALVAAAMATVFPSILSFVQERIAVTGSIVGYFFVGASCGTMALPWLIGQYFSAVGPHTVFPIIAIDLVLASLLLIVIMLLLRSWNLAPQVKAEIAR